MLILHNAEALRGIQTGVGEFVGLTIAEAAKRVLAAHGEPMLNANIVSALQKGGMKFNSADPLNNVGSVLNRRAKDVGDIVRIGRGVWGLREWATDQMAGRPSARHQDPSDFSLAAASIQPYGRSPLGDVELESDQYGDESAGSDDVI
jgi:hypothetical protein